MEEKEFKTNISTFAGDNLKKVWSTDSMVKKALGASSYRSFNRETIAERIAKARTAEDLRKVSLDIKTNQGYADVINYYKSMYFYRYTVSPVGDRSNPQGTVLEQTREMLDVVETVNFEAILPHILETGLYEGRTTLYIEKNGDGLVTHVLPNSHSQPLLKSSYGTDTVVFNLEYFDDLLDELTSGEDSNILKDSNKAEVKQQREKERAELTMAILGYFPKELQDAYLLYAGMSPRGVKKPTSNKPKGPRLINLSAENAAIIPFSPSSAPPKINVAAAEENYKEVLEVKNKKSKAGLEKIFTHRIPIGPDGDTLITVNEAAAIQRSMEEYLGINADITVVTTLGETNLYDVQKEESERNNSTEQAFAAQYDAASINPELFRANTDYALGVSLNRDAAFMWDILQKVMNFYNIALNEMFKFGDYKCDIKLLPITVYNEDDKVNEYRKSAEFGIGKLEAIVASGQKQISLLDKLKLEKELKLDELLTPLRSSHTLSSKDVKELDAEKEEAKTSDKEEDSEKEAPKEKAEEVENEKKTD